MTTRREEWTVVDTNAGPKVRSGTRDVALIYVPGPEDGVPEFADAERIADDTARRIAAVPDLEAIVEAVAGCVRYRAPDACGECIGCRATAALRRSWRIP